ncbi:MAG: S-layer homology domain-containing protein [Candidatus Ornithomonoglobus sp.]
MKKLIALFCAGVMAVSAGTAVVFADETDEAVATEEITETIEPEASEADIENTEDDNSGEALETEIPAEDESTETEEPKAEDADDKAAEAPAVSEAPTDEAAEEPTEAPTDKVTEKAEEKLVNVQIEKTGINPFEDCQNAWFTDYVTFAYENGLIKGVDDTHFDPNGDITCAQLAVILYRFYSNSLDTVTEGDSWSDEAEAWVMDNGIMNDFIGGEFDGSKALTREEVVSTIFRAYQLNNITDVRSESDSLADWDKVSDYAVDAVQWSVATGIIKGVGDKWIAPTRNVTRAEMATILQRYLTNLTFAEVTEELTEEVPDEIADEVDETEEAIIEEPIDDTEITEPEEESVEEEAAEPEEEPVEEEAAEPEEEIAEEA